MKSKIIPFIITCVLIAAHFLRDGNSLMVIISLLFPLLLLIKKNWVLIVSQLFAYLGAGLWLGTTLQVASERITYDQDWIRMALILGAVAIFSGWSGLLLNHKKVMRNYQ